MVQNKDNEFDLLVRSMMENAEEEVPSRVWEKCSAQLDKASVKSAPVLRWPRFLVPLAAAAAVALLVFVGVNRSAKSPELVAEVGPVEIVTEDTVSGEVSEDVFVPSAVPSAAAPKAVPAARAKVAPARDAEMVADSQEVYTFAEQTPAVETVSERSSSEEIVSERSSSEKTASEPVSEQSSSEEIVSEPSVDPFTQMAWEDSRTSRGRMDFSLGGEMSTNGNPSPVKGAIIRRVAGGSVKTVTQTSTNSTYAVPVSLGLGARYNFNDRWAVGTGVQWSMMERTFKGFYKEDAVSTDIYNTLHYIGIPLNVYYNILSGGRFSLYAFAGGTAEKGVTSHFRIMSNSGPVNYTEGIDGFQFSVAGGLGLQFNISKLVAIYLDPSLRYYFDCGQPISIRTQQPLMMGFEAGLRFNL